MELLHFGGIRRKQKRTVGRDARLNSGKKLWNLPERKLHEGGGMELDVKRGITMSWCSSEGPML